MMTKLHPETAQQIADLFSSITASDIMAKDDADNSAYWLARRYKGIVEMADKFGLFLNTYDLAVETLQNPTFRDAVLTADKI